MSGSAPVTSQLCTAAKQVTAARCQQWLLVVVTGCAAAFMAFSINAGIEAMDKLRYSLAFRFIQPGGGFFLAWLVFCASSCMISTVAALGVVYLSPLAAGSGIPHIKAYCNGIDIPGLLTFKTLMVKAIGAMFSIGSGLVAGKEGPFIQCGSCIAYVLSQAGEHIDNWHQSKSSLWAVATQLVKHLCSKYLSKHGPRNSLPVVAGEAAGKDAATTAEGHPTGSASVQLPVGNRCSAAANLQLTQHMGSDAALQCHIRRRRLQHDKAAMGAGAGVAAAFIAPLAGAAYSIEEASSIYSGSMFTRTFLVGAIMVFMLWVFTKASSMGGSTLGHLMFQNPLALAFRGRYGTISRFWWYAWEVPLLLLLGVIGGLIMAAWTALNIKLQVARKLLLTAHWQKVLDVVVCCLLTNSIRLLAAYLSPCAGVPAGRDIGAWQQQVVSWQFLDAPSDFFPQLWCPDQQYSIYGQLFMQPLDVSVRTLFTFDTIHNGSNIYNTLGPVHNSTVQDTAAEAAAEAPDMDVFHTEALAAYFVFTWGMLLLSYGISAPTGIFIPCLSAGAAGGRLAGHLLRHALRRAGIYLPVCMPAWSVFGAAALLTGCTRLAMSNCLIVLESSGAVPLVVPMAMLMIAAKLVADWLIVGIYDYQIEAAGYRFLPPADMMSSSEVAAMQQYKVVDLVPADKCTSWHACADMQHTPSHMRAVTSSETIHQQPTPAGSSIGWAAAAHPAGAASADDVPQIQASQGSSIQCDGFQHLQGKQAGGKSAQQDEATAACTELAALQGPRVGEPAPSSCSPAAPPPDAPPAAAAEPCSCTAAAEGSSSLAATVLLVSADSDILSAYTAMRELALEQLPVVWLLQPGHTTAGSAACSFSDDKPLFDQAGPSAVQQSVQQGGAQHDYQSGACAGQGQSAARIPGNNAASAEQSGIPKILYTLQRKDMTPCMILHTVKDKQD